MRSPLAYAPRPGPIGEAGPGAAALFLLAPALVALVHPNPVVIAASGFAVVVAGVAAGAWRALALAARLGAVLAVLIIAVNVLVTRRGETILVRGWDIPGFGSIDVTLEALVAGGVIAGRIIVVTAALAIFSACVDPDRVLRALRPLARHSALTAGLTARLVPMAIADRQRLGEAVSLRGPGAAPVGRGAIVRRLAAGSLERSVELAATLELRGISLPGPPRWARDRGGHLDRVLIASGLAVLVCGFAGGIGGFETYPGLAMDLGPATAIGAAAMPLVVAVPFLLASARRARLINRSAVVEIEPQLHSGRAAEAVAHG